MSRSSSWTSSGIITTWNRAAEVMKGYTAEEAIGQHLELLYTEEDRARRHAHDNLRVAAAEGFYKEETWRRKKDGSRFWARINLTALKDDAGRLLGLLEDHAGPHRSQAAGGLRQGARAGPPGVARGERGKLEVESRQRHGRGVRELSATARVIRGRHQPCRGRVAEPVPRG